MSLPSFHRIRSGILLLAFCLFASCAQATLVSDQTGVFESFIATTSGVTGKIEILVTGQNTLSGILSYGGKRTALRGRLTQDGSGLASAKLVVSGAALQGKIVVALEITSDGLFSCVVSDAMTDEFLGEGGAEKSNALSVSQRKALAGAYTIVWSFTEGVAAVNLGHAYASAKVDGAGHLALTGKTVDGADFTALATIDSNLTCRIYAMPYKQAAAHFSGTLQFSPRSDGKFHVSGLSDGVFDWKGPMDAERPRGWGPYEMTAWMEPWRYASRATFWDLLGWGDEPLIQMSIGPSGNYGGLRDQYYAVPETAQLDRGFNFISKDFYSYFVTKSAHWAVHLTPSTGVFAGSYLTYDTLQSGSKTTIVRTHKNRVGGVFIQPDPALEIKGSGLGAVLLPPDPDFNATWSAPVVFTDK